ncbi:uncharacterized protein si:dkey-9i23.8 isoform X3 [Pseudoliparis swirei]|uniref:uncharacterized protein si:dkey-9i23.8 isoform X3 n=1 Tax=Pseudoliparis swirei TaxID=2059687 RepID=UPI0024BF0F0E|nr:uncharacterized protein si:dkey-9i23.8 isoform X3 [Pseudoliparis swirei]
MLCIPYLPVSEWFNGTVFMERPWPEPEKWLLVVVLGLEMVMGVVGNCFVLLVKVKCKGQFSCRYWLPFFSLTMSDLGSSLLIICGSLLAMLTGGQRSPWCEVVSLLKFAFITSSIGSIAILCVQQLFGMASTRSPLFVVMVTACLASWVTGVVFGSMPVVYAWISDDEADLSTVSPLLVASYMLCYTPFVASELILLGRMDLSPAPDWLRTLSSVMSYLDCSLNPLIYCSNQNFREAGLALLWTRSKPSAEPVLTSITRHDA